MSHSRLFLVHFFGEQRLRHIVMCSVNYDSCNLNEFTGNVWVDSIEVEFMRRKLIEFFSSAFRYHSFISFIEFSCCSRRSKDKLIVNGDERSNEKKRRIRTKPWLSITCLVRIWRDRHWIIIIINSIIMLAVQCWRGVWLRLASLSLSIVNSQLFHTRQVNLVEMRSSNNTSYTCSGTCALKLSNFWCCVCVQIVCECVYHT